VKFGTVFAIFLCAAFVVSIIAVGLFPDEMLNKLNVRSSTFLLSIIATCLSFSAMQTFLILIPNLSKNKLLKFTYVNLISVWLILSNIGHFRIDANGIEKTISISGNAGAAAGWTTAQLLIVFGMYFVIHVMFTGETEND